ncbi:BRO family protein [Oryzomicrobium sp.]|uniref:BRO-N domain-containing protein n=1 Tax=Oryzomicrobium sp. TaxID=1911578 RepID=UPI0025CBE6FD|nr:BRO family protein [Oryzomicrobium sp.]MCE1243797.1 hypothetical protein [Oryzomicrobium sp.]
MTNNVITFNFNSQPIRVVEIDGNPWFVTKDITIAFGWTYQNLKAHLSRNIGEDERGQTRIATPGGIQSMSIVSESGLYKLVMRSDKPQAKAFQDWVAREVLPSIRKTGAYVMGQPSIQQNPTMDHLELAAAQVVALQKIIAPGFTTKLGEAS